MPHHTPGGSATRRRRPRLAHLSLLLASGVLAACGGGGDGSLEPTASPTRTAAGSVTASVPSPTRTAASPTRTAPSRTRTPRPSDQPTATATATVTQSANPRPTRTATETATETETATATATVTANPTPSETPSAAPSEKPGTADGTSSDVSSVPSWVWWLLAAVLLTAAVALPLVLRSRRRRWQAELQAAEDEVAWFARVLVPDLRAARTAEAIGGAWLVSEKRIAATEDQLTAMAASAPDAQSGDRASMLRDGVRDARTRIRVLIASGTSDAAPELDAVITDLEAVLAAPAASTPPPA